MSIVKFVVDSKSFESNLESEMNQMIKYGGRYYSILEFVLKTRIGELRKMGNWNKEGDFYSLEVEFFKDMVLVDIRKLTIGFEIFRDCVVDVLLKTKKKIGYYQVVDGSSRIGFSIKNESNYVNKLIEDVSKIDHLGNSFKISLTETILTDRDDGECWGGVEGNVYSFFRLNDHIDVTRLNRALLYYSGSNFDFMN